MRLSIRSMREEDAQICAGIACRSEIGERYGFVGTELAQKLIAALSERDELFLAEADENILGFAWADPRGAFSSAPYLRLIAVDSRGRGSGVGSALLDEFEKRTAPVGRDFCLLVSDFNARAITFYEHHGYHKIGTLADFARPGIAEILMVKKRGLRTPTPPIARPFAPE